MSGRILVGIILLVLGIGYLLDLLGVLTPYGISFSELAQNWWPVIVIVIGLNRLVRRPDRPWWPLFVTTIGILLLLDRLLPEFEGRFWPAAGAVVLLFIGVRMLLPRRSWHVACHSHRPATAVLEQSDEDTVRIAASFSGIESRNTSPQFRGGVVEASFGSVKLDLRGAVLAPDGGTLELRASFGGIEVLVPESWALTINTQPTLGGVENKTKNPKEGTPVLTMTCQASFGGIEIKN